MIHRLTLSLVVAFVCAAAPSQITVRDTIEALPPISICQDGATHKTVCTNLRLRPGPLGSLTQFEGWPLEITGTQGAITCPFVTVSSVTIITNQQFTMTNVTAATMTADFFGSGPNGDIFLLFLGVGITPTPTTFPWFTGPVHLDGTVSWFVGVFSPQGPNIPYYTLTVPNNPGLTGIQFFDQALAIHTTGAIETTVVDCFSF